MVSAFRAAGAFGRDSEKGMPPVSVICQVHINGCCHWDAKLLQHILGLLFDAGADPDVQHHRFFHGYHLEFIVMLSALQVNRELSDI